MQQKSALAHWVDMQKNKKLIATLAITAAIAGWAAFRPELIFINKTVNENLAVSANETIETLAKGSFTSQAHETKGTAEIVKVGNKNFLRLSGFHTSNGPDVRVYLTNGENPSKASLPLGAIKGNVGNQNYELPAGFDASKHNAVSIWCERFAVGFGLAKLESEDKMGTQEVKETAYVAPSYYAPQIWTSTVQNSDRTEVTFGSAKGDARFSGKVTLVEDSGKRFAEARFTKFTPNFELRLVKKESLTKGTFPAAAEFVKLSEPKASKGKFKFSSNTPLSKEIDLWLYRSVAIIDIKTKKIISTIDLRSAQELSKGKTLS